MRHSRFFDEPTSDPSSWNARRYHAPSHEDAWTVARSKSARARHAEASLMSWTRALRAAKRSIVTHKNQPSQTLSPRPSAPTRFMPSFQSPSPIKGSPCDPAVRARSSARRQCSISGAEVGDVSYCAYRSCSSGRNGSPMRNGTGSWRIDASPVAATYSAVTNGSHAMSSEQRVRTPRPEGGCHQCRTSPASN